MAIETVRAEMTASVWRVLVGAGDQVEEGDTLLLLEAMKMEIPLVAPITGTVVAVEVAEGDLVTEGQVVVQLEA